MLFEEVRFRNETELMQADHPVLTDYFITLSKEMEYLNRKNQVKGVLSLYPVSQRVRRFEVLPFYVFSSTRTSYASIKLVEEVFSEFYLKTEVLPVINPIHSSYIERFTELPNHLVKKFITRGAVLYGN